MTDDELIRLRSENCELRARLEASERERKNLFERSLCGCVYFEVVEDASGRAYDLRVSDVNPAFESMAGVRVALVAGRTMRELFPEISERWITTALRAVATGSPEYIPEQPAPGGRWFEILCFSPSPGRLTAFFVDVSDRKRLQAQLLQSQKLESLGRLASGVAHDFNNLLTVISNTVELLCDDLGHDARFEEEFTRVREATTTAASLTRQLLEFGRPRESRRESLSVTAVVQEMVPMLRRLLREDILVETALEPDLAPVRADRGQIKQVLLNLAANAGDAMPYGGTLTFETSRATLTDDSRERREGGLAAGPYARLTVRDTGVGIDAAVRERLFDDYVTTKPIGKGTGLGLSTVRDIVRRAGGGVFVESEPGQGSTFHVLLPESSEAPAPIEEPPSRPSIAPPGRETVLIVEDNHSVRSLVRRVLHDAGYMAIEAPDPRSALDRFRAHGPGIDVVITDLVMPHMHGRDLALAMRAVRPKVKVLFTSGYADDAQGDATDYGISFIQKPFSPAELLARVRALLDA